MALKKIVTQIHEKTKRNYLGRMVLEKKKNMKISKKYDYHYWDGNRKYGYGGFKYIPGRLTSIAKKLIKTYKLKNNSKILDVGCGKGFLLFEIKKLLPRISVTGFDVSHYAIKNSKKEIKENLFKFDLRKKLPFKNKEFDLVIAINVLHNFKNYELFKILPNLDKIAKKKFLVVESYRNENELFNLQCWALTCETFLSKKEWEWMFKYFGYNGDFEFIYFK